MSVGEEKKARVAVIGGGVAGLTVAHELADKFEVTVFERRDHVGGKAFSTDTGALPAEHGFRFFPGFYWHVVDTMKRIPAEGGCVASHLVPLSTTVIALKGRKQLRMALATAEGEHLMWARLRAFRKFRRSMPGWWERLCFVCLLARLATACNDRWEREFEHESWLEHVSATERPRQRSKRYRTLFAIGLTRGFVATRAEDMSARTGGKILLQLMYDSWFPPPVRRAADRALDGPTTKVWIEPWRELLAEMKVTFETGCEVIGIDAPHGYVSGIQLRRSDGTEPTTTDFDWYVLAVPCEVLKQLLVSSENLRRRDPQLAHVFNLTTKWMNGIVFGLKEKLRRPLPQGHILCVDSQWALTLVDQATVWSQENLCAFPGWQTVLSVDVSDWDSPGTSGLPAKWFLTKSDRSALVAEIWAQLREHVCLPKEPPPLGHYKLDADIRRPPGRLARDQIAGVLTNDEPLLVNTPGSWANRPNTTTAVPNLFIAGDFVRTHTNFASMEAANESGRRAANAVLEAAKMDAGIAVRELEDPNVPWFTRPLRVARRMDEHVYRVSRFTRMGLRSPFRLPIAAWIFLGLASKLTGLGREASAQPADCGEDRGAEVCGAPSGV